MPVSDEYITYLLDRMAHVGTITHRRMFGGAGLYCDGLFFAIIVDDVLYFKVDDTNRPDYEAEGSGPFTFTTDRGTEVMNYYEVPIDVLENKDNVKQWAEKALKVAQTAKQKKTKKLKKTKKTKVPKKKLKLKSK